MLPFQEKLNASISKLLEQSLRVRVFAHPITENADNERFIKLEEYISKKFDCRPAKVLVGNGMLTFNGADNVL